MQLTNEWIEQGLQQGRQQGLQQGQQQGRRQGLRDVVLRQLRRRLGVLPAKVAKQVERLDDEAMLALGDALLDFTSAADAHHWLAARK